MTAFLHETDERGIVTVTLNRPERHNAFDDALIAELTVAFTEATTARALVLRSAGPSFCAGADLGWMRRMAGYSEAENIADARALAAMLAALDTLPCPTIAVAQGPAYGGGVGLLACCDIVVAAEGAKFRLSEVLLGLTPATISPYVVRAIGARQARRYFVTAEVFNAARAQALGLVHEIAAADTLEARADEIVRAILQGAPGAEADAKALVTLCEHSPLGDALADETARQIAARRASPEGREGVSAFLERRRPAWQRNFTF